MFDTSYLFKKNSNNASHIYVTSEMACFKLWSLGAVRIVERMQRFTLTKLSYRLPSFCRALPSVGDHHICLAAMEDAVERFAEVLIREAVQQWVQHAVGVAERCKHLVEAKRHGGVCQEDDTLDAPVGQPAANECRDNNRHQSRGFTELAVSPLWHTCDSSPAQPCYDHGVKCANTYHWQYKS